MKEAQTRSKSENTRHGVTDRVSARTYPRAAVQAPPVQTAVWKGHRDGQQGSHAGLQGCPVCGLRKGRGGGPRAVGRESGWSWVCRFASEKAGHSSVQVTDIPSVPGRPVLDPQAWRCVVWSRTERFGHICIS